MKITLSFSGLQALVKAEQPRAVFVHCAAHRLNLVVQDSFSTVRELRDVLHQLGRLVEFVRESPKRLAGFAAKQPSSALRPLCPTRWLCREASVRSVLKCYRELVEYLEELAADTKANPEASSTASGFAKEITSFSFYFGASLALKLLDAITPVIKAVQGPRTDLQQGLAMVRALQETLAGQRNRFDSFWEQVTQDAKDAGADEPVLPRARRPPKRIDDGAPPHVDNSPKDRYRRLYIEGLDAISSSLLTRFGMTSDASTLEEAERALTSGNRELLNKTAAFYGLNSARLQTHVEMMHDYAASHKIPLSCLQEVRDLMQSDGNAKSMVTEVKALLKLLLTAPLTSCTAERSFSMLRRLKSWLRSTMTQHRLNSVAICAAYPDELRSLNVARIVDGFIRSKPVRSKWFAAAEEV